MRVRDSGMPEEDYWETLFDVNQTLEAFRIEQYHNVAEIGCGYGTFTLPLARAITGNLVAYDIDPLMVQRTRQRTSALTNVTIEQRDVFEVGMDQNVDAVLLFNILHCDEPVKLLRIAASVAPTLLVTHWQSVATPRGPSLAIRPRPQQIVEWAESCNLFVAEQSNLPPWHFGMVLKTQ